MNIISNRNYSFYISNIYNHFVTKFNKLAVVYASIKILNKEKYFRYYKINIYKSKNFNTLIELLKKDIINVSLISRMNKSGIDAGRYRNKNLVFQISKDNIEKMFYKIYTYNLDRK